MTTLEQKALEAAEAEYEYAHEQFAFQKGYLAAAQEAEQEIRELKSLSGNLLSERNNYETCIEERDAEIAALRAKLEAVPAKEMQAIVEWELGLDYPCEASSAIERWLAGLAK